MTPPPTDRLRELIALKHDQAAPHPETGVMYSYVLAPLRLWEEAQAEIPALLAQADRAARLEVALRVARPHLEFDCIDDEDQKVLEAARDTVDAALADAEGGT